MLTQWLQALIESLKLINSLLPRLLALIDSWIAAREAEAKRIQEAEARAVQAEVLAREVQYKKETANVIAFQKLITDVRRIRYEQLLAKIKAEDYSSVLVDLNALDNEQVNRVLFEGNYSPEYRALKIVNLILD